MRALRFLAVAGLLLLVCVAMSTGGVHAASHIPSTRGSSSQRDTACPPTGCVTYAWNFVPSDNLPTADNMLFAMASVSATDKWAVGLGNNPSPYQTLIERYNGTFWQTVPSPNMPDVANALYAVTAVTATDVWAGGFYEVQASGQIAGHPLFEHWDGNAWSIAPSPDVPADSGQIQGLYAVSANNIWAVGYLFTQAALSAYAPLVEHWDGSARSLVDVPIPVTNGHDDNTWLQGVSGSSATDIWAVGYSGDPLQSSDLKSRTLFEHWDGVAWSIVTGANPSIYSNTLYGITASASNDVWVAGADVNSQTGVTEVLLEHWTGSAWTVAPAPSGCSAQTCAILLSISARSSSDIWAVGSTAQNVASYVPMVVHWNGSSWSRSTIAPYGGCERGYRLDGVAAASATDVSAVGWCDPSTHPRATLAAHLGPAPFRPAEGSGDATGAPTALPTAGAQPTATWPTSIQPTPATRAQQASETPTNGPRALSAAPPRQTSASPPAASLGGDLLLLVGGGILLLLLVGGSFLSLRRGR